MSRSSYFSESEIHQVLDDLAAGGQRRFWVPPGHWEPLLGLDPVEGPGWNQVRCSTNQFPAYVRQEAAARLEASAADAHG